MESRINKRKILSNTIFLYVRLLFIMGINLYVVRIVLQILGETDYGIYNVVGGIVAMFTFLSGTMAGASQRFFSYELGKEGINNLKEIFAANVTIYAILAAIIIVVAETVGLWFLNAKLNIPETRMHSANIVYQFSILAMVFNVLSIPFQADITAHEKMNIYAYISVYEVVVKLLLTILLTTIPFSDKLELYSILMAAIAFSVALIYFAYARRKFEECHIRFGTNKKDFSSILSYAGWTIFGALASVVRSQGINMLINIFFNTVVNAARGIAYQVFNAISQFANNFFTAVRPQIVKSYAAGEYNGMKQLVFQSSRFSFYLILLIALPLLFETETILDIWLDEVPEHAIAFTRLVIINAVIESLANPLIAVVQATGNVKKYQLIVGCIIITNLPVSYIFLSLGYNPESTMVIAIVISVIAHIARITILHKMPNVNIKAKEYIKKVILTCLGISILATVVPLITVYFMEPRIIRMIVTAMVSVVWTALLAITIGMNKNERKNLVNIVKRKTQRKENA
ncbi:MAG: oligosaccharide flippase family protein [Bacteroidales bacterium]|nr:oligosaccharide flippase family protein [Bacteroidales bacterium]